MLIKDKLYMMAKDHDSAEAERLVELVEEDGDYDDIVEAKDEFLHVLSVRCQISPEDFEELSELNFDAVLSNVAEES